MKLEIHFKQYGWLAFDPTPRADAAMCFAAGRNWVYFSLEEFTGVTFASMLSPLAGNFSLGSISAPGWLWVVFIIAGVTVTVVAFILSHRRARPKQRIRRYSVLGGESRMIVLNLYRIMVKILVKNGLPPR